MWQRIQTLWLVLSVGCMLFVQLGQVPLWRWSVASESATAGTLQEEWLEGVVMGSSVLTALLWWVILLLLVGALMSFRRRPLQMLLVRWAIVMTLFVVLFTAYYAYLRYADYEVLVGMRPSWGLALLALSVVFDYLALRNIRRDEELVRSADRLR